MLTTFLKYTASALTYAGVMTEVPQKIGFVPVPYQEIDCGGKTYQSFVDATKSKELDKDKPTSMGVDPKSSHHLPPGVAIENAPQATQDAITDDLLNNRAITVRQGDEIKGGYICRLVNS